MNHTRPTWKARAAQRKRELWALYLAYRHPRTPWYAKAWTTLVLAYAASPIDLIPDFVPVLGYLDDLLLLPMGAWLALKLIPTDVMAECRAQARADDEKGTLSRAGVVLVAFIWLAALSLVGWTAWRIIKAR